MKDINIIRDLAKKVENQNMISISKELPYIQIFRNKEDLSYIQNIYLSYLFMYSSINLDIDLKKVDKIILNDYTYEDAYILWKKEGKEIDKKTENKKRDIHLVFTQEKKKDGK